MANNSVPLEFKAGNSRRCGWRGGALVWSAKELGLDSGWLLKEGALACLPFRRLIFLLTLIWRMVWRRGSVHRQRHKGGEEEAYLKKVWTTNSVGLDGYWLWVGGGQGDPWVLSCMTQGMVVPLNETGKHRRRRETVMSSFWVTLN